MYEPTSRIEYEDEEFTLATNNPDAFRYVSIINSGIIIDMNTCTDEEAEYVMSLLGKPN